MPISSMPEGGFDTGSIGGGSEWDNRERACVRARDMRGRDEPSALLLPDGTSTAGWDEGSGL